ncbi:hypothetical protein CRG98_033218 [Punica granatum]|uniref:Uncharacterized protein n=1 Tax=Punica granatum TaxID=22663 RepID=A0A2I0IRS5_PUNGR|nr:hypothetical protein CRG98_033218 [Punica granatum]
MNNSVVITHYCPLSLVPTRGFQQMGAIQGPNSRLAEDDIFLVQSKSFLPEVRLRCSSIFAHNGQWRQLILSMLTYVCIHAFLQQGYASFACSIHPLLEIRTTHERRSTMRRKGMIRIGTFTGMSQDGGLLSMMGAKDGIVPAQREEARDEALFGCPLQWGLRPRSCHVGNGSGGGPPLEMV